MRLYLKKDLKYIDNRDNLILIKYFNIFFRYLFSISFIFSWLGTKRLSLFIFMYIFVLIVFMCSVWVVFVFKNSKIEKGVIFCDVCICFIRNKELYYVRVYGSYMVNI